MTQTPELEGLCPVCHNEMQRETPRLLHCDTCKKDYYETYLCPTCGQDLQQVKGCGAINYICPKDGLVSSKKVKFHYLAQ